MKKIIVILLAGVMLTGFSLPLNNSPVAGEVTELTGYRLKHNQIDVTDFNLWVVTSEDVFARDFEPMYDSVVKPEFDRQMVLAAKVQTANYAYRAKFKRTVIQNGILHLYFNVIKEGPVENIEAPVSMIAVPKDKAIKKVHFYHKAAGFRQLFYLDYIRPMKIAIINGPNLNLLGKRETDIYGNMPFEQFLESLKKKYPQIEFSYFQSNVEGELINELQRVGFDHDGIILNPGGYTHTSVAIGDAVAAIKTPVVEVHISNIHAREDFRKLSHVSSKAVGSIFGLGLKGYELALEWLLERYYR